MRTQGENNPGESGRDEASGATLKVLLGDYPHTRSILSGGVKSEWLAADFIQAKPLNTAFKRMVRDLEFDISELSLTTFLQAKDLGKPLVLLSSVLMSRFQHPYLVYDAGRGPLAPEQLSGRRIGCRLFTSNTAVWLRFILAQDYGVGLDSIEWVAFQEPHVAEFSDPPRVHHAPPGSDLMGLLSSGAVDAVVIDPVPADPRIKPVIPDPEAAARDWAARYRAIQINHMLVATEEACFAKPEAVREFWRLLALSHRLSGGTVPIGLEACHHDIDLAIECVFSQGLIGKRFEVEDLLNDLTSSLAA